MRTILIIGFASGLLAAALPAQAANSSSSTGANHSEAAPPAPPQANGAAASARRICVRDERSETRIRHLTCRTAQEWRDIDGEVPGEH